MNTNFITEKVIGAAIEVHKELGPGLLESAYEHCLLHELRRCNIGFHSQVMLPVFYKGLKIDAGYKLDILVPNYLVVELKSVSSIQPIHTAQLITYLKLTRIKTGLIINFNLPKLLQGLKRVSL